MAGSLGGRARRVRKLEGRDGGRQMPEPSQTELEARALDAEIREAEEGLRALGVDPDEWHHGDERMGSPLDEQIAAIEKEICNGDHHREASGAAGGGDRRRR